MSNLNDQIIVFLIIQILENQKTKEIIKQHDLPYNAGFSCHFYDNYLINFFLLKTTDLNLN